MPDLAEWTVLLLERQARLVELSARRVPLAGRLSEATIARVLEWTGVFVLLVLGVLVGSALVWALLAVPMTVCVLAFLAGLERTSATPARTRPVRSRGPRSGRAPAGVRPRGI